MINFKALYKIGLQDIKNGKRFKPNSLIDGTLYFYSLTVDFSVNSIGIDDCVILSYFYNGRGNRQWIEIDINSGRFICPSTGLLCNTLYFFGGRFAGRLSINGGYYPCQIGDYKSRLIEAIRRLAKKAQRLSPSNPERLKVLAEIWRKEEKLKDRYGIKAMVELGPINTNYIEPLF